MAKRTTPARGGRGGLSLLQDLRWAGRLNETETVFDGDSAEDELRPWATSLPILDPKK